MPDNVSLVGAGIYATTIRQNHDYVTGTVRASGTTNHFRDITISGNGSSFGAAIVANGASLSLERVRTEAGDGVILSGGTTASITQSILHSGSNGDNALRVDDATVVVEHSIVYGDDRNGDGVIYSNNAGTFLTVRYSFIGTNGVSNPWSGALTCAYISGPTGELGGCPFSQP